MAYGEAAHGLAAKLALGCLSKELRRELCPSIEQFDANNAVFRVIIENDTRSDFSALQDMIFR